MDNVMLDLFYSCIALHLSLASTKLTDACVWKTYSVSISVSY